MTNINAEEIRQILIPLPPDVETQQELVATMDTARAARRAKREQADGLVASMNGFLYETLGLPPVPLDDRKVFAVSRRDIPSRFDPHFHLPSFSRNTAALMSYESRPLATLARFSRETWNVSEHKPSTFKYIEIGGVNLNSGEASSTEVLTKEAPSRARMLVRDGDIIVSLTRPHHGAISQITSDLAGSVASTGFAVIREVDETQVSRDYLWSILRSRLCLDQMLQRASGGNYPAITESELGRILIPVPSPTTQQEISTEVKRRREQGCRLRAAADSDWKSAKHWFEEQLLGGNQE
jgi:restriction endonuclease S subunit